MAAVDERMQGRHTDYYGRWDDADERRLFEALGATQARFILSTWHHNDYWENSMLKRYWHHFNIVTRDHFYHSGAKLHNRRAIVEALVFNFDSDMSTHNFGVDVKRRQRDLLEVPIAAPSG